MLAVLPSLIAILSIALIGSLCGEWCAQHFFRTEPEVGSRAGLLAAALAVQIIVLAATS